MNPFRKMCPSRKLTWKYISWIFFCLCQHFLSHSQKCRKGANFVWYRLYCRENSLFSPMAAEKKQFKLFSQNYLPFWMYCVSLMQFPQVLAVFANFAIWTFKKTRGGFPGVYNHRPIYLIQFDAPLDSTMEPSGSNKLILSRPWWKPLKIALHTNLVIYVRIKNQIWIYWEEW